MKTMTPQPKPSAAAVRCAGEIIRLILEAPECVGKGDAGWAAIVIDAEFADLINAMERIESETQGMRLKYRHADKGEVVPPLISDVARAALAKVRGNK